MRSRKLLFRMLFLLLAQATPASATQLPNVHRYGSCVVLAAANSSHGKESAETIAQAALSKCRAMRKAAAEEYVRAAAERSPAPLEQDLRREVPLRMEEQARKLAITTVTEVRKNPPKSDGKTVFIRRRP
jgi:hypothetical protein